MQLIDTHAHLDSITDIKGALERANNAGVSAIVAVGENKKANLKNLELARSVKQPQIILAFGIHPGDVNSDTIDKELAFIEENIAEARAIGEIGLDFWYKWVRRDKEKKEQQRRAYRRLLEIARAHNLPALIHTRGTWREAFEIAKEIGIQRAVFHWYSGPVDVLEDILKQGYFISASPSIAYSPEVRQALEIAPVERALIETDSPVFYKQYENGLAAEPKDVFCTLHHYARLKQVQEQEVAEILNANARSMFKI